MAHARSRFSILALLVLGSFAVLLGVHLTTAPAAAQRSRRPPSAILRLLPAPAPSMAYTPDALWGAGNGRITSRLGMKSGAIYLIDGAFHPGSVGRVIGDPAGYLALDAKVSPRGDLIAFHGRILHRSSMLYASDGIGVLDTDGVLVTYIPRGETFAWSPEGNWLAITVATGVVFGDARGLAVWNRQEHFLRLYEPFPSRVGWISENSLLLQLEDRVEVLDPRVGIPSRTGHHGTIVSPDGLYSMWPGERGLNTRVIEDETGRDITNRLWGPMERQGLRQIRSAFWMLGEGADHLMVVSGSDNLYGPETPRCRTAIVDAATGDTIAEFPGEAMGPTGDGKKAVVLHHETGLLEAIDLEEMVRGSTSPGSYY